MPDSCQHFVRRACRWALMLGLPMLLAEAGYARTQGPVVRLPLESFDYQTLPAAVVKAGASALTLHYVDADHLLLTFSRRRLMKRLADDPPTDFDRNIDAVLLELPTGKVLARTSWRVHDASQYLWALSEGNFLLRERNRLVLLSPMAGLKTGEAFAERPFVASARFVRAIQLSPAGDLLTLETVEHAQTERSPSPGTRAYAAAAAATAGEGAAEEDSSEVQVDFFRIVPVPGTTGEVKAVHAGQVTAGGLVRLPMDASGLLTEIDQGRAHWAFDFHRHDGKVDELSPFDSTCRPQPMMVSRSEFIALGCKGGQDRRMIGGFNLRGEEMWEQGFLESFTHPELSFAPAGGRFALGRMVSGVVEGDAVAADGISAENVSVYQTESGRVLLNMNLTPVLVAGQNFTLSPDGQQIAVVNNGAVEVYALPGATEKERKAMQLAETLIPPRLEGPVRLEAISSKRPQVARAEEMPVQPAQAGGAQAVGGAGGLKRRAEAAPVAAVVGKPAAGAAASLGDAAAESTAPSAAAVPVASAARTVAYGDETVRHAPPTLYAPGEKGADGRLGAGGQTAAQEAGQR